MGERLNKNPTRKEWLGWLDRLQPSESIVLSAAALAVGLTSAAGIWLFKQLIEWVQFFSFDLAAGWLAKVGGWSVALLPMLGGLLVGWIMHRFVGQERHHGVAGIMESVALAGGRLRYWRIPAKALASSISIGCGASVGPEDPSVQIGSNLGSMFGQWLRLSDERVRTLVAAGAAGGIAAAFNAPIAGVFFALEIILGELSGGALGVVLVTAVVSSVFTQAISGAQPAFRVPEYAFNSVWELPLYLGLGFLAGPLSALYIRFIFAFQDFFHHLSLPGWAKTVAGGAVVGVVGIFFPQVFGVGYETIEGILGGKDFGLLVLVVLLAAKLLLTPLSIAAGFQGGVFAPALFLGAVLGGGFGTVAAFLFPGLGIQPPAFAMVGMGAVLAGTVHAPLTAILLLFEMTGDYRIILPLMFAVAIGLLVSQRLQRESVYALGLKRKGIRLERGRDVEVLEALYVSEVMQTGVQTLPDTVSLAQASEILEQARHHGMAVTDADGNLVGILTLQDIDRARSSGLGDALVGEVCTRTLLTAFPDETIGAALRRMGARDIGRLPVVDRNDERRLVGWLRRADMVRAYDLALTRRAATRHTTQQARLGAARGDEMSIIEVTVQPEAQCAGRVMKEIAWPTDCLVASLRRGRRLMIPRGDTVIRAGDVLVVVADEPARAQVQKLCSRKA